MFRIILLITLSASLFLANAGFLRAQDAYHSNLRGQLQTEYGLPPGAWVLHDTEAATLAADFSYGSLQHGDADAADQDFTKKVLLNVDLVDGPQWNTGYGINNVNSLNAGDRCLLVFWAKAEGEGKVSLAIQNSTTFQSELYITMPVDDGWRQYLFPFEASEGFDAGGLQFQFQLNWMDQQLEIGGIAVLNYGAAVELEDLPRVLNNEFYDGYQADAPWRAEAAQRIEQIRKADLGIEVVDAGGMPLADASVQVRMLEHEFGFGTAVAAHLFAGNSRQNAVYEQRLLDLDGQGHRFNCVVFENATKWRAWEQNWFGVNQSQKAQTVQWLNDRGIKLRGHTLIWPSWNNLPDDIFDNQGNADYITNRVLGHIEDILTFPGMEDGFTDWDVLNEISVLNDLANAVQGAPGYPTGREIYVDIIKKFKEVDPDGITYINDYTTFGGGSSAEAYADLKNYLQEIVDAGLEIDGVGFQGHIGAYPTGLPRLYDILEDFYTTFGTEAKITEFDMNPLVDDELAAQYLRDFYTLSFSHPSVNAILMWGFWDGAHWFDNAPMFRQDWSLKPAGEVFLDLVFEEWWTEESGLTGPDGAFDLRGFKGRYEIVVGCPGATLTDTIDLTSNTELTIDCSMAVSTEALDSKVDLRVFPNPTDSHLEVQWTGGERADIVLFDLQGRRQSAVTSGYSPARLNLDLPPGLYQLVITMDGKKLVRRVVVE